MISFITPEDTVGQTLVLGEDPWKDLEMDFLAAQFRTVPLPASRIRTYLQTLDSDLPVLRWRQGNLKFLLDNPGVFESLEKLTNDWIYLKESAASSSLPPLKKVLRRLGELETWVRVVTGLNNAFGPLKDLPGAWADVKKMTGEAAGHRDFTRLQEVLPQLRAGIQGIKAVSIGINLNHDLEPVGAVLLSVEPEAYKGRRSGILGKLFQNEEGPRGELHQPPYKTLQVANQTVIQDPEQYGWAVNPKSLPLFRDLEEILKKTAGEMDKILQGFSRLEIEPWRQVSEGIVLLVATAGILRNWTQKGVPLAFPELLSPEENRTSAVGMLHPPLMMLALRDGQDVREVIPNDLDMGDRGRVQVITGPNSGGKTVYLQSIGWAQVLTQLGWPLPAQSARVSPTRSLGTHFEREEESGRGSGKFGDEVARLKSIFLELKPSGLILMNESLSGTNALESYAIACDLMKVLRVKGARAGFTTHLHELARDVDELNQEVQGPSLIASLAAHPGEFKVDFSPPSGRSQAREIAVKHGLSFEQLT